MSHIITAVLIAILVVFLIYLWMIAPRMIHRPDMTPFKGWLYAHRGLHDNAGDAPENTMPAFRKAIEQGFGMEMDIQLTKDDVVVVVHDADLKRVCGVDKKVCDLTYEELQQYKICNSEETVPKFSDFLALVDGQVPLIIEYKSEDTQTKLFEIADAMLREYKGVYCVESFNPLLVRWYRKHHKDIVRGILSENYNKAKSTTMPKVACWILKNLLLNFLGRPDFIAFNHKHYNEFTRQLCRKIFPVTSVAWTIKSQKELEDRLNDYDLFIFDSFVPDKTIGV